MRDWKFCSNQQDLKVQYWRHTQQNCTRECVYERNSIDLWASFWMNEFTTLFPFLPLVLLHFSFICPDLHCFYGSVALKHPTHPSLQHTLLISPLCINLSLFPFLLHHSTSLLCTSLKWSHYEQSQQGCIMALCAFACMWNGKQQIKRNICSLTG